MDTAQSSGRKLTIEAVGDREIVMTRALAAPRQHVFEAWTSSELVPLWFGRHGWAMPVCTIDLRVGGGWRYVMHGNGGGDVGLRGVYREIAGPDRLSFTESYDHGPSETLNTLTLVEHEGITTMIYTLLFATRADRDKVMQSKLLDTASESFDRLDEMMEAQNDLEQRVHTPISKAS